MNNTVFNYLFRAEDNSKKHGKVIFSGAPSNLDAFEAEFRVLLMDGDEDFDASQIDIHEIFLQSCEDDDWLHEFECFDLTDKEPTDEHGRSITEFLEMVKEANERGWVPIPEPVVSVKAESPRC